MPNNHHWRSLPNIQLFRVTDIPVATATLRCVTIRPLNEKTQEYSLELPAELRDVLSHDQHKEAFAVQMSDYNGKKWMVHTGWYKYFLAGFVPLFTVSVLMFIDWAASLPVVNTTLAGVLSPVFLAISSCFGFMALGLYRTELQADESSAIEQIADCGSRLNDKIQFGVYYARLKARIEVSPGIWTQFDIIPPPPAMAWRAKIRKCASIWCRTQSIVEGITIYFDPAAATRIYDPNPVVPMVLARTLQVQPFAQQISYQEIEIAAAHPLEVVGFVVPEGVVPITSPHT